MEEDECEEEESEPDVQERPLSYNDAISRLQEVINFASQNSSSETVQSIYQAEIQLESEAITKLNTQLTLTEMWKKSYNNIQLVRNFLMYLTSEHDNLRKKIFSYVLEFSCHFPSCKHFVQPGNSSNSEKCFSPNAFRLGQISLYFTRYLRKKYFWWDENTPRKISTKGRM